MELRRPWVELINGWSDELARSNNRVTKRARITKCHSTNAQESLINQSSRFAVYWAARINSGALESSRSQVINISALFVIHITCIYAYTGCIVQKRGTRNGANERWLIRYKFTCNNISVSRDATRRNDSVVEPIFLRFPFYRK